MSEVSIRIEGTAGRITLTRPDALHALTLSMCEQMIAALLAWESDPAVKIVLIDHEGGRGFCAGGDIRALVDSLAGDGMLAERFFLVEYQLDHLIFSYAKPVVCFMDGIVMGGGAGVALASSARVATERTTFAMPECGIGLFPDVGAGRYLSRLPGEAGLWLALTGQRIKAADARALGLATHYVEAASLEGVKAALLGGDIEALAAYAADPGPSTFAPGSDADLAQLTAAKCPMMLAVTRRLLVKGAATEDFAEELTREYALAVRTIHRPDFTEGVRATVIDKDQAPRWNPATLAEVSEAMVDAMFEPLPHDKAWTPLR